jgi:hypothetical protein
MRRLLRALGARSPRVRAAMINAAREAGLQDTLLTQYREMAARGVLPAFSDAERRFFSQNGEDGILLLLFGVLGMGARRAIEICAGDGIECNSANLIINHGWQALLVDGDARQTSTGARVYAHLPSTRRSPPRFATSWVTAENVNDLIRSNGFDGDVDLLSIDLDGMDYWIWKALDAARPRVVVLEYQTAWGPRARKTVEYEPAFELRTGNGPRDWIFGAGASLGAFIALGAEKGYRYVGSQCLGFNAFFLRNDVGLEYFPEADPNAVFLHPHAQACIANGQSALAHYSWMDV